MLNIKNFFYSIFVFFFIIILSSCKNTKYKNINENNNEDILKKIQNTSEINWGVKYDSRLFSMINISKKKIEGFEIDIAKALTKELLGKNDSSYKANFLEVTSKTRVPLLKNNNVDAVIASMTITEERKKYVDFSEIYFYAGQSLLVHKDSNIKTVKDLNENTIVLTVKGSTSAFNIKNKAPKSKVLEFENYSEAFVALKSGQGDVMTTDTLILAGLIKEDESYKIVDENFVLESYGIAVNKNQKNFLNELNNALTNIKNNGTYDEIYKKWFLK